MSSNFRAQWERRTSKQLHKVLFPICYVWRMKTLCRGFWQTGRNRPRYLGIRHVVTKDRNVYSVCIQPKQSMSWMPCQDKQLQTKQKKWNNNWILPILTSALMFIAAHCNLIISNTISSIILWNRGITESFAFPYTIITRFIAQGPFIPMTPLSINWVKWKRPTGDSPNINEIQVQWKLMKKDKEKA